MPDRCEHPEHHGTARLIRTYDEPDRPDGWLDVLPGLSLGYERDGAGGDLGEQGCNLFALRASRMKGSNPNHISGGQFCAPATFTPKAPPFRRHIGKVVCIRAEEQMRRSDARAVVTVMQDMEIVRNRTDVHPIGHSMRIIALTACASWRGRLAVSVRGFSTRPHPTRTKLRAMGRGRSVLVDVRPEALLKRAGSVSPALPAAIERGAVFVDARREVSRTCLTGGGNCVTLPRHREPHSPGARPRSCCEQAGASSRQLYQSERDYVALAVSVTCTTCLSPLQFVGLPIGDGEPLDGGRVPAMSLTGTEVYLPCRPIVVAERATGGAQ